jgi:CBS domain containing-hemolysin-like protein
VVHVRDAVRATTFGASAAATDIMAEPLELGDNLPVARAIRVMRDTRAQIAVVIDETRTPRGVVALEDLLEEVIGEFDDETDPIPTSFQQFHRAPATPTPQQRPRS